MELDFINWLKIFRNITSQNNYNFIQSKKIISVIKNKQISNKMYLISPLFNK